MSTTLPEVLQAPNMLGYAEQVKSGLCVKHLPPGLLGGPGLTRRTEGDTFTYTIYSGQQKTARAAAYGSPSRGRTPNGPGARPGKTIWSSENMDIRAAALMNLLDPISGQRQRLGESEVARMLTEATTLRQNFRTAAVTSALCLNNIYLDGEGNMLPSSSGAIQTIAMPTQATYTKSASWATASTDILGDLQSFSAQAIRTTGLPIANAIYGSKVLGYLMTNTNTRDLIVRNVTANQSVLNAAGGMVFDLCGIRWYPGQFGFFQDDTGTNRQFLAGAGTTDDQVVFTPEVSSDWFEFIEGTSPVKNGAGSGDANQVWAGIDVQQGMWQYAVETTDSPGMKIVYGDNFLPCIKVTSAVGLCDTVS